MSKLLIATTNKAKLAEFKKYFSVYFQRKKRGKRVYFPQLKLLNLSDLKVAGSPLENGKTFEENALVKARFYAKKTGLCTLADDGGFEIKALGGKPGVFSKRWPGYEATDEELVNMVMEKLKGVPPEKRQAQLRTVVVIVDPRGQIIAKEEGEIKGIVPKKPACWIEKNFPFRAVLYLPQFKKFYQDLTKEEHDLVNHRKKVVLKIAKKLKSYFKTI